MRLLVCATMLTMAGASGAYARSIVQVGSCVTGLASYPTIQSAITGVAANGTVEVCPGTYAEQLVISKNLTLKAALSTASPNQALVAIVPPAGGLQVNATDLDPGPTTATAAQILVTGSSAVNIEGLTVDGANNQVTDGCNTDLVGILYQQSSGIISGNWVKNQIQPGGLDGCQGGLAIYVETGGSGLSTVTVAGNVVENFQKNGITGDDVGTTLSISNNTILGNGPTTGAAENGIQIAYGASATIKSNSVGDEIWAPDTFGDTGNAAAGILVYDSPSVLIQSNTVASTQYGIAVVSDGGFPSDGASITGNNVRATHLYDAVDVCGAGSANVSGNTILGADESAIHIDSSCGPASTGNTVSSNTINGTCAGVLEGVGSTATISSNKTTNTASILVAGSDVCPVVQAAAHKPLRAHPRFRPFH